MNEIGDIKIKITTRPTVDELMIYQCRTCGFVGELRLFAVAFHGIRTCPVCRAKGKASR